MAIGDLLASISGTKSPTITSTNPSLPTPTSAPFNRKAQDDMPCTAASKALRSAAASSSTTSTKPSTAASSRPSFRPSPDSKPSSARIASSGAQRPPVAASEAKPAATSLKRPANAGIVKSQASKTQASSRPNPAQPSSSLPPKKGSFAEIMKRARESEGMRESFGKIQHEKTADRRISVKERKDLRLDARKQKGAVGVSSPGARNGVTSTTSATASGARSNGSSLGTNGGAGLRGKAGLTPSKLSISTSNPSSTLKRKAESPVEDKRPVKKAATATTGYTGTARPRPGGDASKPGQGGPDGARSENGSKAASQQRKPSRYGGPLSLGRPTRQREDDYDEEMDDFIDDDDDDDEEEESGYGARYGQASRYSDEDESDMEAGLTDIDEEEQAADRRAREEDRLEEARLQKLKREKEERKRRFLEAQRGK